MTKEQEIVGYTDQCTVCQEPMKRHRSRCCGWNCENTLKERTKAGLQASARELASFYDSSQRKG